MRTIDTRQLMATVAIAALIGAMAGFWATGPSTASTVTVASAGYCSSNAACMSRTWLWLPAMRRSR